MKDSGECPKCGSTDIKRFKKLLTGGGLMGKEALGLSIDMLGSISKHFECFVCRKCGYTEVYLPEKYLEED